MERRGPIKLGILLTAIPCALFAVTPLSDRDWPWHLADYGRMTGERLAPWDRALWQDRFSYASEGEFLPVHWVFELALGAAHRAFGLMGVELVRIGLVVAIFTLLHRLLAKRGLGPVAASAVALTVAAITRGRLIERPHLVTLLGLVILWDLLVTFRDGKRRSLWPLVPLLAIWANAHPGVVYGAILAIGFALAELIRVPLTRRMPEFRGMPRERARPLVLWVVAGLAATLFTPYGLRLYPYLLEHRAMQAKQHIAELRPLDLHHEDDVLFLAGLGVAAIIMVRAMRRGVRTDPTDLLATLGFVVLAVVAAREANLALVAAAVTLAPVLAATIREARGELIGKDRGLHVFAWSFALLLGFSLPVFGLAKQLWDDRLATGLGPMEYPVAEADWILEHRPHGRLWNSNASGGYLIWRLDPIANPEWQVFTDGRQPLFGHAVNMTQSEIEERFAPNLIVWDPKTPPYDTTAFVREHFALVHFSDGGRTYLRKDGKDAALAAKYAYRHIWFVSVADPTTPETVPWHWRLAITHDANAPVEAKFELMAGALSEEPGGHWGNVALAQILFQEGDHKGAAQAARRALDARRSIEALQILQASEGR